MSSCLLFVCLIRLTLSTLVPPQSVVYLFTPQITYYLLSLASRKSNFKILISLSLSNRCANLISTNSNVLWMPSNLFMASEFHLVSTVKVRPRAGALGQFTCNFIATFAWSKHQASSFSQAQLPAFQET